MTLLILLAHQSPQPTSSIDRVETNGKVTAVWGPADTGNRALSSSVTNSEVDPFVAFHK